MKRLPLVIVLLLIPNCALHAGFSGVEVLWQQYHVKGEIEFSHIGYSDSYEQCAPFPISGELTASAAPESCYVLSETSSSHLYAELACDDSLVFGDGEFPPELLWASADYTVQFRSSSSLQFVWEAGTLFYWGALAMARITDVDSGAVIFAADTAGDPQTSILHTFQVNPLHRHELWLYAGTSYVPYSNASWDYNGAAIFNFELLSTIPVPGAIMLGTFGVGLVSFLRGRRVL